MCFIINIDGQVDTLKNYNTLLKNKTHLKHLTKNAVTSNRFDSVSLKEKAETQRIKKFSLDNNNFKTSNFKLESDSNKTSGITIPPVTKDTCKNSFSKKIKSSFPKGTLSLGYDYGFLPYTINMRSPASAFKTEGLIEMDLFNIPLDVSYFYTTQKNLIGLTNYFRISYNSDRYKDKLNSKLNGNLDLHKTTLGKLTTQKQQLMQKMAHADYLYSVDPEKWPIQKEKSQLACANLNNGRGFSDADIPLFDTVSISESLRDSLKILKYDSSNLSTEQRAHLNKHKRDSVRDLYNSYKDKYDIINDSIRKVENKIDAIEELTNKRTSYSQKTPYLNKVQNFLSGVKKMDIGLCYPSYSNFLTNNTPVKGINFEYEKNNRFLAFTYGTTVSTLLYNNRNIDAFFQNVRNMYNYFDFNNMTEGKKILSVKFGIGEKEKDHVFAGFMIGKGITPHSLPGSESSALNFIESNLVVEVDFRKKISKNTSVDVVLGKSSVQEEDLSLTALQVSAKEIFSNNRSYALLVKLKTRIPSTKSNLSFSIRQVDPFFNSFGTGFIRSDNRRYEIKLDQPLGRLIRYTVMFRHEEDNILKILNYKNTFYSVNNTVSYRIKKGLMLRIGYAPLVRELNGENYHTTTKNSIATGILSFTPRCKNSQKQYSLLYNSYKITTDSTPLNFQNLTYYHQFSYKSGFKTGFNISWFNNSLNDSTGKSTFLAVLDGGFQFKNGNFVSLAGKSAYRPNGQFYPGFILKLSLKITKTLLWDSQVEKFIVGDLFNGYDLENIKRFPYYFTTKLILNF